MKTEEQIRDCLEILQKKLRRIENSLYAMNGADCTKLIDPLKQKIELLKWVLGEK